MKVKVGSKTRAAKVKLPVPGSLFMVGVGEVLQALSHLDNVLGAIEGALHA